MAATTAMSNTVAAIEKNLTLKDGRQVTVRSMHPSDVERSYEFFCALPEEDRKYLRADVTRRRMVERRTTELDRSRTERLVVVHDDEIVADGKLGSGQSVLWVRIDPTNATVVELALDYAAVGLTVADLDLVEINEAFAAVSLHSAKLLGLPHDKVNINGGAIALGHPLGGSGARIVATLIGALRARGGGIGGAALCGGGGQGDALIIKV